MTACSDDREVDAEFGAGAVHHGDDAGGGEGDAAAGEADALVVHGDLQRLGGGLVVVEGFAHAHDDDVRQQAGFGLRARPFAVAVAGGHELADDLAGGEVADELLGAGVAEAAGEGAAHLGRDADGAAVVVGDVDGLDLLAVAHAEEPLAGGVGAGLLGGDLGAADGEAFRQLRLHGLGDGGHGREVAGALVVDPVPELLRAEGLLADRDHLGREFVARQAEEVAAALGVGLRGRREDRGLGEDAGALGLGQVVGRGKGEGGAGVHRRDLAGAAAAGHSRGWPRRRR